MATLVQAYDMQTFYFQSYVTGCGTNQTLQFAIILCQFSKKCHVFVNCVSNAKVTKK